MKPSENEKIALDEQASEHQQRCAWEACKDARAGDPRRRVARGSLTNR
jgi:hypothetical protein